MGHSEKVKFVLSLGEKLKEFEALGEYTYDLKTEIFDKISRIESDPHLAVDLLEEINGVLITAKKSGLNVKQYFDLVYDFRIVLLKFNIDTHFDHILSANDSGVFNMKNILTQYDSLVSDGFSDSLIDRKIIELKEKNNIEKLKFQITQAVSSQGGSNYDLSQLMDQIDELEKKGIDVSDIQRLFLG